MTRPPSIRTFYLLLVTQTVIDQDHAQQGAAQRPGARSKPLPGSATTGKMTAHINGISP
ncbi:MAG: hypothetical protein GYB66_04975 [Chloroflexi bacterium]|nr:hypothetical protein [Chloroflexota bacterium]